MTYVFRLFRFLDFFSPFLFLVFFSFFCSDRPSTGLACGQKTSKKASSRRAVFTMEQPGVVAGNFGLSFSLNFLSIFVHISGSILPITLMYRWCSKVMTSEVEERQRLIMAGYRRHGSQWVNLVPKMGHQHLALQVAHSSSGRIIFVLFWTNYAVPCQIRPGILKLTFRRCQSNFNMFFIFVSCKKRLSSCRFGRTAQFDYCSGHSCMRMAIKKPDKRFHL